MIGGFGLQASSVASGGSINAKGGGCERVCEDGMVVVHGSPAWRGQAYQAAALYPLAPPAPTVVLKGGWIGAASVRELRLGAPAGGSGFKEIPNS